MLSARSNLAPKPRRPRYSVWRAGRFVRALDVSSGNHLETQNDKAFMAWGEYMQQELVLAWTLSHGTDKKPQIRRGARGAKHLLSATRRLAHGTVADLNHAINLRPNDRYLLHRGKTYQRSEGSAQSRATTAMHLLFMMILPRLPQRGIVRTCERLPGQFAFWPGDRLTHAHRARSLTLSRADPIPPERISQAEVDLQVM